LRNPPNDTLETKVSPLPPAGGSEFREGQDNPSPNPVLGGRSPGSSSPVRGTGRPETRKREGNVSERRCVLSGERASRDGLIRLALAPDGRILPDVRAKAPGRGAWIGVGRVAFETALAKGKLKGALMRAFKTSDIVLADDLADQVGAALLRNVLDRLGLEARAGTLVTGSERIDEAARKGALHALYHAADAGEDGNRKLDQAWRVGADEEGSGRRGLILSVDRTILSAALGRENVVHIGVIDARAAARVSAAIDQWHGFMDFKPNGLPCETRAQGSGPHGASETV
jgi:uncharacterized protein